MRTPKSRSKRRPKAPEFFQNTSKIAQEKVSGGRGRIGPETDFRPIFDLPDPPTLAFSDSLALQLSLLFLRVSFLFAFLRGPQREKSWFFFVPKRQWLEGQGYFNLSRNPEKLKAPQK